MNLRNDEGRRLGSTNETARRKERTLAPSHHLRPMLTSIALVLSATLALSACGAAKEAGAAAVVNGTVIKDQDVQTVSGELNRISPDAEKLSSSETLFLMILTPYVLAEAKPAAKTLAADQARKVVSTTVTKPLPSTVSIVQMQLALQQFDDAAKAAVVNKIAKARISVNPRYGTFDASQVALIPNSPNWIKPSATPPAQ